MNRTNNQNGEDVQTIPSLSGSEINAKLADKGYNPIYGYDQLDLVHAFKVCDTVSDIHFELRYHSNLSDEKIAQIEEIAHEVQK